MAQQFMAMVNINNFKKIIKVSRLKMSVSFFNLNNFSNKYEVKVNS